MGHHLPLIGYRAHIHGFTAKFKQSGRGDAAMESRLGHRLEKFVGVTEASALTLSSLEKAELRAAHLTWKDPATELPTRCDVAEGYMVYLLRRELPPHPYWVDQRPARVEALRQGQFLLLDLRAQHEALVSGDVDCVSIFTSSDAIKRYQEEHDFRPSGLLRAPHGQVHDDSVVLNLAEALLPVIRQPELASQLFVEHVALALLSRLTSQHGTDPTVIRLPKGGLAPWQERRAKEMMGAYLDGRTGLNALAAECRLSRAHFARAFKVSTGMSPMRWLALQRIERAKMLLVDTNQPLAEIAASCGFADPSHLTRTFIQFAGTPPGAWRRQRQV
jgi:AraC-like DNA-binding protein